MYSVCLFERYVAASLGCIFSFTDQRFVLCNGKTMSIFEARVTKLLLFQLTKISSFLFEYEIVRSSKDCSPKSFTGITGQFCSLVSIKVPVAPMLSSARSERSLREVKTQKMSHIRGKMSHEKEDLVEEHRKIL